MPMRDDNNVDVFRTVACSRKPCRGLAGRKTLAELLIFARERTIARVKQDQLLAGVHERRNIGMLESLSIDIVGASKSHHLISCGVGAVVRMQTFPNCLGIQNRRNLELAEFETVNRRLYFALECSGHLGSPRFVAPADA